MESPQFSEVINFIQEEYGDAKIFINKFPADKDDVGEMRLNNLPLLRLSEFI